VDTITVGELRRLLANMPEEAVIEVSERGYLTLMFLHPDGRCERVDLDDIEPGETYHAYKARKERQAQPGNDFAGFLNGLLFQPGERERIEAGRNLEAMDRAAELPQFGAFVRLTREIFGGGELHAEPGEKVQVFYEWAGGEVAAYVLEVADPPPRSDGRFRFRDRREFLDCIEPAHLGRDPQE
jgi:hypothetical protein